MYRDHAGPWALILGGNLAAWSGSNAAALVGLLACLYGVWIQHELLALRRIEVAARLRQPVPAPPPLPPLERLPDGRPIE
jgi:hypothetical protein